MKLVALCLFAVCCSALAITRTTRSSEEMQSKKLQEVLRELNVVKSTLQNTETMINTPPQDIEDCCYVSALQCFQSNLKHFIASGNIQRKLNKLHRSLGSGLIKTSLNFCDGENIQQQNSTCQACDSHPKVDGKEFFNRLETLIQRALSKLNMNREKGGQ